MSSNDTYWLTCGVIACFAVVLQEMDPLNAAVVILNTSRRQVRDDVVHQTDGKLESAIWELQQQSEQECKQFKQELSAAYEDKVGTPFWLR